PRSEAYFVFPLAQGTPGKQCGLAATGVYQPSLRSPWLAAIEVVENYLVIRGQKNIEREHTDGRYHILECAYGSFERALPLPDDVIADEARASYKRGVLRIELPKSSAARRHRINVKVQ
uniref:Hsp20/alpha crystallin family protein n=1 Tax=Thiolapillus sp. TaxID=2017437 RepID=UPI003AF58DBF